MKRVLGILLAMTLVFSLNACGKPPQQAEPPSQDNVPATATATGGETPEQTISADQVADPSLGTPEVISDISNWKHPIRKVLEGFGFTIVKVELYKDKTYPVITVDSVEIGYSQDTHGEYIALLKEAARANGYWDYGLTNRTMDQKFQVVCDLEGKSVKNILLNGKSLDMSLTAENSTEVNKPSEEQVIGYLMEQVPEIAQFNKQVEEYNKMNNTSGKPIVRIDSTPDAKGITPYEKDFYAVYIGESTDSHTNRWGTFLVRKDLKEILADDPATGQYITLQQWREGLIQ